MRELRLNRSRDEGERVSFLLATRFHDAGHRFHKTMEENVRLCRPQFNASDVREALAAVGLLDEIMAPAAGTHSETTWGLRNRKDPVSPAAQG